MTRAVFRFLARIRKNPYRKCDLTEGLPTLGKEYLDFLDLLNFRNFITG